MQKIRNLGHKLFKSYDAAWSTYVAHRNIIKRQAIFKSKEYKMETVEISNGENHFKCTTYNLKEETTERTIYRVDLDKNGEAWEINVTKKEDEI